MKFKNLKIKNLFINLFILLIYPFISAYKADTHLLVFSDNCLIIALIMLLIGIINSFHIHGDFDIMSFVAQRVFVKNKQNYDVFIKNEKDKKKDSFNYPLFSGLILLSISLITSLFL